MDGNDFPEFRIEIILEQRRPGSFEIFIGPLAHFGWSDHIQFFPRRDELNDTGRVGHPQLAQGEGAMTPVVQYEAVFDVDGIEKIRAKTDRQANHASQSFDGGEAADLSGLKRHGPDKAEVI